MIKISNFSKEYNENAIFSNVNIELPNNGIFILKGKNGSGKTTFLNCISGTDMQFSGEVIFNDFKLTKKSAHTFHEKIFKYIYQDFIVPHNLTVEECVSFPYLNKDINKVHSILKLLNLYTIKEKTTEILSTGELKRLFLAISLYDEPKVLILDEFFAVLDPQNTKEIFSYLKEISKNVLIIISTNQTQYDELFEECNSIFIDDKRLFMDYKNKEEAKIIEKSSQKPISYFQLFKKSVLSNKLIFSLLCLINLVICSLGLSFLAISSKTSTELSGSASIQYSLDNLEIISLYKEENGNTTFYKTENYFYLSDEYVYGYFDDDGIQRNSELGSFVIYHRSEQQQNYTLLEGRYPTNTSEYVISSFMYEKINTTVGKTVPIDSISLYLGKKIVGVYSFKELPIETEYEINFSICPYGYQKYNIFSFAHNENEISNNEFPLIYNYCKDVDLINVKGYKNVIEFVFIKDGKFISILTLFNTETNKLYYDLGIGLFASAVIFSLSSAALFIVINKKRVLVYRFIGISSKKIIFTSLIETCCLVLVPLLMSNIMSVFAGMLYGNTIFNNVIGRSPIIFNFSVLSLMFNIVVCAFPLLFSCLSSFFIYHKNIKTLLETNRKN